MSKKLWGTRFNQETDPLVNKFISSILFDQRLAKYDILGSIAHARMLGKQGLIPAQDARLIIKGLNFILKEVRSGKFKFDLQAEDVHSNIQEALYKKIGQPAQKLHTARSRNDQIALDIRMYLKDEIEAARSLIVSLQRSIGGLAKANIEVIIPGYTHLRRAQCVLLAHHLLAYVEAIERDKQRLKDAKKRIDSMPLGSAAFSGTGLPIDREFLRRELGFRELTRNSIDSVSDRDFILEVLSALSILAVHLSRIAEDLIIWSTQEFDFIDLDFSFCTGSSIMPHKKNPDVLELIRGLSGRIFGDFSNVIILMKGLPYSYNRDLQLDKPPLFEAIDTVKDILGIFSGLFAHIKIKKESLKAKLKDESLFSVDIVEYLIKQGLSYRQAHDIVGSIVKGCLDKGRNISDLSEQELKKYSPSLDLKVKDILNPKTSVNLKTSDAGTNPRLVARQLKAWERRLKDPQGQHNVLSLPK